MVGGWGAVGCADSATGAGSPSEAMACSASGAGVESCSASGVRVEAGSVGIGVGVGRTNGASSSADCGEATLASSAAMAALVSLSG